MSLSIPPPSSPNPNNKPVTGNGSSKNSNRNNEKSSLSGADISQQANAQREVSEQEGSASTSGKTVNKSTSPVRNATKGIADTKATLGVPNSSPDGTTSRIQSADKDKMIAESRADVAPDKNKKDESTSPSTGSSSPAVDPLSRPGGAGTALGQGSVAGNNNGIINNNTNYGNQGIQSWNDLSNVTIPPATPQVQLDNGFESQTNSIRQAEADAASKPIEDLF